MAVPAGPAYYPPGFGPENPFVSAASIAQAGNSFAFPQPSALDLRPVERTEIRVDVAAFGPVSEVLRLSIATPVNQIELILPDRTTVIDALGAALDSAPLSVREQAVARGGWALRTATGVRLDNAATLLDQQISDGTTLYLFGLTDEIALGAYDDVADAVADAVLRDAHTWPKGAGRIMALGTAGLWLAVAALPVLLLSSGWNTPAIALGLFTAILFVAAGLASRGANDGGIAVALGLAAVGTATIGATVATGGVSTVLHFTSAQFLIGGAGAVLAATIAGIVIGTRWVPFGAVITAGLLLCVALACTVGFHLHPAAGAAILTLLAMGLMPVIPSLAFRLARFNLEPLPSSVDEVYEDIATVEPSAIAERTRSAVGHVTALIQGAAWPVAGAGIVLAFSQDVTAQVLVLVVVLGLLLRARLFIAIGQRLPLLLAAIAALTALFVAEVHMHTGSGMLLWGTVPAAIAAGGSLLIAGQRKKITPGRVRISEILELLSTIAIVPLVATVLGLVGFIRGLGG